MKIYRRPRKAAPVCAIAFTISIQLLCFNVHQAYAQEPCCFQADINGGDTCTPIAYCNENETNCIGDCEGIWGVTGSPTCLALDEACSPTAPRPRCCEPYDCINAINNVGVCGVESPTIPSPTPPSPTPPAGSPTTLPTGSQATYYFGHSLIYHTFTSYPNTDYLAVPYWMNQMYGASGPGWYANGEWNTGDPNYVLPPNDAWFFGSASDPSSSLSAWQGDFASTANLYTSIVYTDLNFVQWRLAVEEYGYNPTQDPRTPIDSIVRILDFMDSQNMNIPFFIYECWADAGPYLPTFESVSNPPSAQEINAYYAAADFSSNYHQWWVDLYNGVLALRPDADVRFMPVGPVLINTLRSQWLSGVPFEELFEDNSPHGLPNAYFLAALIQYIAITGEQPPAAYAPPSGGNILSSAIINNYQDIVGFIETELNNFVIGGPVPTPSPVPPVPGPTPAPVLYTPAPVGTPTDGTACCIQPDINGPDECTTIDYCNQNEVHCTGDCGGTWTIVGSTPAPVPAPTPATPAPQPTPAPVPNTPAPVGTPTDGTACCIQPEINGPDDCTTIDWCNQDEINCTGDCEGTWTIVGSTPIPQPTPATPNPQPTPAPVPAPVPNTPAPVGTPSGGTACCIQPEINGPDDCTTINYCNQNEVHCTGNCEGTWTIVGSTPNPQQTPAPVPAPVPNTPAPVGTPSGGTACCIQPEINGPDECTTIDYCNQNEVHCTGDCEGTWTGIGES